MQKVEPLGRRITKLTGPIVKRVAGVPIPGDDVFDAGEALFAWLEDLHGLLTDPDTTSIRVVLTARQVIAEAQRSFTYFHLYGYLTDLVIANGCCPTRSASTSAAGSRQQRYGPLVDNTFHPIPVRKAPYFDQEVVGMDRLRQLAARCSPTSTRPTSSTAAVRGHPRQRRVPASVDLPFTEKRQINPSRRADELIIDLGSWRRTLVLPRISSTRRPRARGSRTEP